MDDMMKPFMLLFVVFGVFIGFIVIINAPIPLWTDSGRVISVHYGTAGGAFIFGTVEYVIIQTQNHGRQSATDPCQRTLVNDTVVVTGSLGGNHINIWGC